MPFKDKKKYRDYMASYMREYRMTERALKQVVLADIKKMEKLKAEFPDVYQLFAGERSLAKLKNRRLKI